MARKKSGEAVTKKSTTPRKTTTTRCRTTGAATSMAAKSVASASVVPHAESQIRARAYFLYLERRGDAGDAVGDWLEAEKELNAATRTARG